MVNGLSDYEPLLIIAKKQNSGLLLTIIVVVIFAMNHLTPLKVNPYHLN